MRTPVALMLCLLLSGLVAPFASADALPPPDDLQQESPPAEAVPIDADHPARPSWSIWVVATAAMSVLIFMYLRRKHTLPADPATGKQP